MKKFTFLAIVLAVSTMVMAVGGMSGVYKVGVSEVAPNYTSLSAAVADINTLGVAGNIVLEITSDITEPANFGILNSTDFSITIRPDADTDRLITFTQAGDNTACSGNIVIGLSNVNDWASIGTAKNITIDGYAVGGSTRRLILENVATNNNACKPVHIIGFADNITVKNCILTDKTSGSSAFGVVSCRVRNSNSIDYIPNNIVVDNCLISTVSSTAAGIFVSNSGTPVGRPVGIVFKNNDITVRHRAISINYSGTSIIDNNVLRVNQTASGMASFAIGGTSAGLVSTTISNNRIVQLGTANTAGAGNGIRGIQASAGGTWNIFNNFITGFATPATGTTEVVGIRVGSASNVYNNTIVLNNVTTTGPGTTPAACVVTYNTAADIKNNILITEEDDFASYAIYASSIPNSSDYNILYRSGTTNAKIGFVAAVARETLVDWQTGSEKDANSKSVSVTFTDSAAGNLLLAGASVQDANLAVPRLPEVLKDILGTDRADLTYAGAHESTLPFITTANPSVEQTARILRTPSGVMIELDSEAFVEIYTMNGVKIESVRTSGSFERDLDNGVYIIRINGAASKFMK